MPRPQVVDHALHETLITQPTTDPALEGRVIEVLRHGYEKEGRVLRFMAVRAYAFNSNRKKQT
jgi:molecular chaperone GrpE (heat shock protein)